MENEQYTIVIDHLSDPGNQEKQAALQAWLDESADNCTLYNELKAVWDASTQLPSLSFDKATEWETLRRELQMAPTHKVYPLQATRNKWWRIAAVALPLLVLGSYVLLHRQQEQWQAYTAKGNTIDSLHLPDGSVVYLQPGTALTYNLHGTSRQVKLQTGEAFFDVIKDEQHPFSLQVPDATISVLGTAFNVKTAPGYSDVTVRDGKVSVGIDNQSPVILIAGNMAVVAQHSVHKQPGDYSYRYGWTSHDLAFTDQPVSTVLKTLEQYYQVRLQLQDTSLLHNRITIRFNQLPLPEALLVMGEMLDLQAKPLTTHAYLFTNK
ncbi:FecR family protein [Chitinophaga costaii]|uniref:FecR family protein n=1 Tax=Chitinophaga costaii TaxID=1335309 RepID=A0A1C4CVZ5_9BACT|nr:FecR domain-containing protein [Chitinophaga costaii]PUZ26923.1 DUF4974 domain-containing protein [Chitinophaga costaii]SCC23210.1 FecR family protein [Chitinophaga costaii]